MSVVPELRNAYLKDLGLMAVDDGNGVLVLVDIENGRQYIGQGLLGTRLRTPGAGPIPSPSISRNRRPSRFGPSRPSRSHPERGPRGSGSFRSSAG